jgi:hypothetical protein
MVSVKSLAALAVASAALTLAFQSVAQAAPSSPSPNTPITIPTGAVTYEEWVAGPVTEVTTEYTWSGSEPLDYGYEVGGVYTEIGSFQGQWVANLNGAQDRLTQHATWLSGPSLQMDEQWQCWTSSGSLCNVFPNEYTFDYPYSTNVVGYTYTASNANTASYLPTNGTSYIHFNWNWLAFAVPNPYTSNGRFNAPPMLSPPISCVSGRTAPCEYT